MKPRSPDYRTRLISHLSDYNQKTLGNETPGVFRYRGADVPQMHILAPEAKWDNLLAAARDNIRSYLNAHPEINLHRYFHHLTSSQAFAFNLFIPFFEGGEASSTALLRAFGQDGQLASWEPEAVPDRREGTNVDARWTSKSGAITFCEVKLSEGEFGKATNDDRHRLKLQGTYKPILQDHISQNLLEEKGFFASYQILRNLWHTIKTENARLVFLMPRANTLLWHQLATVLDQSSQTVRDKVSAVAIETLLSRLISDQSCPLPFVDHAREIQRKYVPDSLE